MFKRTLALAVVLLLCLQTSARGQDAWGSFQGELLLKPRGDGRTMELVAPYSFLDANQKLWAVPTGTVVDGASIPQAFWTVIGGPFEGKYRDASVIHDYYCDTHADTWQNVHMVFYNGMRAKGVDSITAKVMYAAVCNFGPRWLQVTPDDPRKLISGKPILLDDAAVAIVDFIKQNDPSLPQIQEISAELAQVKNFAQLEILLQKYAQCTPIIANEDTADESLRRTIILCGLSVESQKRAALRNIRSLNDQLRKLLETQQRNFLPAIDDYIASENKESWAKVSQWSGNVNGLIKASLKSVLKVEDPKLKNLTPPLDDVYEVLNKRAAMMTLLEPDKPLSKNQMQNWVDRYRVLVAQLARRLSELEKYLETISG